MTDSFSTRCAVLQGMSTWALLDPRPLYGTPKGISGAVAALIESPSARLYAVCSGLARNGAPLPHRRGRVRRLVLGDPHRRS